MIEYRNALVEEIDKLKKLLWKYGPNEWNYLTKEGVDDEFLLMQNASASAVVATYENEIIGFSVLIDGDKSPEYLSKYGSVDDMCFIGDVVVSSNHSGKGVATQLLIKCLDEAKQKKYKTVLVERHEENLASAGMMKKAGFSIIDVFYDPDKREKGSKNSVILSFKNT